ncbi:septum formation initiator family protein [Lentisphaera profundi]|uniref:Septum formation initiator family protein n=1 Tax=Lentisphaera profundi TaxID=1658616 RepID=A0ABY7VV40_9BACT|nr:septum formation initiator family protein [Lentisphaera profundi]WDE98088.1 septum formation initiator family protein [Lentisphaera profundi]
MEFAKLTGVFLFLLIVVSGTYIMVPKYIKYNRAQTDLEKTEREVMYLESDVQSHRESLHDLTVKPSAVERVAREKFGLCRKGERVIIFKDEDLYREQLAR